MTAGGSLCRQPLKGFRRRSEVDRQLDTLVAPSGKLRDVGLNNIVRMLRLFNLCDVGTTTSAGAHAAKVPASFSTAVVGEAQWPLKVYHANSQRSGRISSIGAIHSFRS